MSSLGDWSEAEEFYLIELCKLSQVLAQRYNECYLTYRRRETRVRIPIIALSSISGLVSFGTTVFPPQYHGAVNISVGVSAMFVALVGSIESFLKIPEIIAGSVSASLNFTKLAESISVELALPRFKRNSSGIVFLRESYKTYEKYSEAAPNVFKHIRFVRPFATTKRQGGRFEATESNATTPSTTPTPSPMQQYRNTQEQPMTQMTMEAGDSGFRRSIDCDLMYVPTNGYALRAPRPPNAIDLPV
jgi:hypothetical protein